jgi:hypothetical protein
VSRSFANWVIDGGRSRRVIGTFKVLLGFLTQRPYEDTMNGIVYIVGLVVIVVAILGFFGFR